MSQHPYLEKCIERVAELRREPDIVLMQKGKRLDAGKSYTTYTMGSAVLAEEIFLALKIPHTGKLQFMGLELGLEIAAIDEIIRRAPALSDKPPDFIGIVAIGGHDNSVAMITEDATEGGVLPIRPISARPDSVEALREGFSDDPEAIYKEALTHHLAFAAGDRERWLDFSPPPVHNGISYKHPFEDLKAEVRSRQEDLTLTIPSDSPLALSMG